MEEEKKNRSVAWAIFGRFGTIVINMEIVKKRKWPGVCHHHQTSAQYERMDETFIHPKSHHIKRIIP